MTGVTPKGEMRRDALIIAAARLLAREGLHSLTHRAVAAEAGLPLASTTYYFADLDELEAAAVRQIAEQWHSESCRLVQRLRRRPRGVRAVSRLCALITLGRPDERRTPLWRSETFIDACRNERLRAVVAQSTPDSDQLIGELLARSGYPLGSDRLEVLCAAIDGAILRSVAAATDAAPAVERIVVAALDSFKGQGGRSVPMPPSRTGSA